MSGSKLEVVGARYCGNKLDGVVHDLANQTPDCHIEELNSGIMVKFERIDSAIICGFVPCRSCIEQHETDKNR